MNAEYQKQPLQKNHIPKSLLLIIIKIQAPSAGVAVEI